MVRAGETQMNLKIGDRVQLHPATNEWMQGDRYGLLVRSSWSTENPGVITAWIVKLDSGRVRRFHPNNIIEVI